VDPHLFAESGPVSLAHGPASGSDLKVPARQFSLAQNSMVGSSIISIKISHGSHLDEDDDVALLEMYKKWNVCWEMPGNAPKSFCLRWLPDQTEKRPETILHCCMVTSALYPMVGTVTEETNDYFATRYWALKKSNYYFATRYWAPKKSNDYFVLVIGILKKVTIISLLVTGVWKKVMIISLPVTGLWKKITIISLLVTGLWKKVTIILLLVTFPTENVTNYS
jgi:hypothetical protein